MPIEAVVLIETRVFCGDDGVLEIGRDLVDREEGVALAIRFAVHPGLHAAFDVDGGGGRVDPAEGEKGERGEGPDEDDAEGDPFEDGSGRELSRGSLGGRVWSFRHTSG